MKPLILFCCLLFFISCEKDRTNPLVDTIYLPDSNGGEEQEIDAAIKLYEHYMNSSKDKDYFEVVSKHNFILNYYPAKQWITICLDPGSGWYVQYKDVNTSKLGELSKAKLPFVNYKDILIPNDPMQSQLIKSNGHPN